MTDFSSIFSRSYDVVIIGSGAGGGTLAYSLATKGRRVLLLERGEHLPREADNSSDRGVFGDKYNSYEEMDICGSRYPATIHAFVGGETKLYGASLYRLRREDFEELAYPDGISPAWPIRYEDLEPYYSLAENIYKVHGDTQLDTTEPPHSSPYPYPPIRHEPEIRPLVNRLQRMGLRVHSIPKAIQPDDPEKCSLCSTCDGYACPTGGKLDTETACITPARTTGNLTLITGAYCTRLLTDEDGRTVVGLEVNTGQGEYRVDARFFIVSCGIMQSPALLLRSANTSHPHGIGNRFDQVGRNLSGHNAGLFFLPGLRKQSDMHQKTFAVHDYYLGDDSWRYPLGIMQAAGKMPLWRYTDKWLMPFAKFIGERSITCFIMSEVWPDPNNRIRLDSDKRIKVEYQYNNKAGFRTLRMRFLKAFWKAGYPGAICSRHPVGGLPWHPVGSLRMGDDPGDSATDRNCKIHGIDNLYAVDASVLPTAGAVNTSLTIMAIALRAGDHLDNRLENKS